MIRTQQRAKAKRSLKLAFILYITEFRSQLNINVIMFYAPVLFKTLGFNGTASLMSIVITGLVNLVSHACFGCCAVCGRWAAGFVWLLLSLGEADELWSLTTGITASPTAPPPPPPYVRPSEVLIVSFESKKSKSSQEKDAALFECGPIFMITVSSS